jgi:hypothetical protein
VRIELLDACHAGEPRVCVAGISAFGL